MLEVFVAMAAIGGMHPRPVALTGPFGHAPYQQKLEFYLDVDGASVRRQFALGDCQDVRFESGGFDEITDRSYRPPRDWFRTEDRKREPGEIEFQVIEHVDATGCGKSHRHNFVAWRERGDPAPSMTFSVDGFTRLPVMELAGAEAVAVNMIQDLRRAAPSNDQCDMVPLVYDTRVEATSGPGRSWSELWSVGYCSARRDVRLTFTPRDEGLAIQGEVIK